jgi:hypothetical protein
VHELVNSGVDTLIVRGSRGRGGAMLGDFCANDKAMKSNCSVSAEATQATFNEKRLPQHNAAQSNYYALEFIVIVAVRN